MRKQDFINRRALGQMSRKGHKTADLLLRWADVVEDVHGHERFKSLEQTPWNKGLAEVVARTTASIRSAILGIHCNDIPDRDVRRRAKKDPEWLARFLSRSAGKDDRKLSLISTIGHTAGILNDEDAVHVYDPCGGSGILSTSFAFARDERLTSATCIEIDEQHRGKHELLRLTLGGQNPLLKFSPNDVVKSSFAARPDMTTYCCAKHACGTATDAIVNASTQLPHHLLPVVTLVVSCCHGAEAVRRDKLWKSGHTMRTESWIALCGVADLVQKQSNPVASFLGRTAMRLADTYRVMSLPDTVHGTVQEIVPASLTPKNHALVIKPAN